MAKRVHHHVVLLAGVAPLLPAGPLADRVFWREHGQFTDIMAMATVPVCGMAIEQEKAVAAVVDGRGASFCSRGCRDEFLAEPARFPAVA